MFGTSVDMSGCTSLQVFYSGKAGRFELQKTLAKNSCLWLGFGFYTFEKSSFKHLCTIIHMPRYEIWRGSLHWCSYTAVRTRKCNGTLQEPHATSSMRTWKTRQHWSRLVVSANWSLHWKSQMMNFARTLQVQHVVFCKKGKISWKLANVCNIYYYMTIINQI